MEHKRYVYCREMLEHKEMEMQKLTLQHEVDLIQLKYLHKQEIEKVMKENMDLNV